MKAWLHLPNNITIKIKSQWTEEKKCKIQHTGQMFTDAGVEVCMYENREINISIGE